MATGTIQDMASRIALGASGLFLVYEAIGGREHLSLAWLIFGASWLFFSFVLFTKQQRSRRSRFKLP